MDTPNHHSPSMHDYRNHDKALRKAHMHQPSSWPGMNGSSDPSHKGQTMWNDDPSYRMLPSGYLGGLSSHEAHRSPIQAHRYTPGANSARSPCQFYALYGFTPTTYQSHLPSTKSLFPFVKSTSIASHKVNISIYLFQTERTNKHFVKP